MTFFARATIDSEIVVKRKRFPLKAKKVIVGNELFGLIYGMRPYPTWGRMSFIIHPKFKWVATHFLLSYPSIPMLEIVIDLAHTATIQDSIFVFENTIVTDINL